MYEDAQYKLDIRNYYFDGDNYQVVQCPWDKENHNWRNAHYSENEVVFEGSLSDCESYIRLKERGYSI